MVTCTCSGFDCCLHLLVSLSQRHMLQNILQAMKSKHHCLLAPTFMCLQEASRIGPKPVRTAPCMPTPGLSHPAPILNYMTGSRGFGLCCGHESPVGF